MIKVACLVRAFPVIRKGFLFYLYGMSNEITHILRGVFLFIVLALVIRLFLFLSTIRLEYPQQEPVINATVAPAALSDLALKGKPLFKANCAACHAINKITEGPSLVNVIDRWPSKELLYMWINNWNKAVATGDPYAIKVKNFSSAAMNTFKLTDEEIDSILAYINESSKEDPAYSSTE